MNMTNENTLFPQFNTDRQKDIIKSQVEQISRVSETTELI